MYGKQEEKTIITKEERQALLSWKNNKNIVIKPAGKGGAIVILNKTDYIQEGLWQLDNLREIGWDHTPKFSNEIHSFLNYLKEDSLLPLKHIQFYSLKVPHTRILLKKDNPGRPIVFPTERLSKFVDHYIKPLAQSVPSYIQDANNFPLKLSRVGKILSNSLLVTIDVTALYTYIPHQEGIWSLTKALERPSQEQIILSLICLS